MMDCKWHILHNVVEFIKGPCMINMKEFEQGTKTKERKSTSHFGAIVPFSVEWALKKGIGEHKWYLDPGNKLYKSGLQVRSTYPTSMQCTYPAFMRWIACHFNFLFFQMFYIPRFHAVDCFCVFSHLPR